MPGFNSLKPLKVSKRRTSDNYSSLPIHEASPSRESFDSEKQEIVDNDYELSDEECDPSSFSPPDSSRETSGSYTSNQPMIKRTVLRRRPRGLAYRIPQKIMRYLCFAILSAVVIFILYLIQMSILDSRKLEEYGDRRAQAPKQWDTFPFLNRYYGGIRSLVPLSENKPEYPRTEDMEPSNDTVVVAEERSIPSSKPFKAYPDYASNDYLKDYAPVQECFLDDKSKAKIPPLRYFDGRPSGFPDHVMGSYDVMGLPENICFERYGRLGPYGHGYSLRKGGLASGRQGDMEGSEDVWKEVPEFDYTNVDWGTAQQRCYNSNAKRFRSGNELEKRAESTAAAQPATGPQATKLVPRTAVIVRTWDEFVYREEDILYLRGLIAELSLGSGGEYDVHLLVQVKDESIPVFADEETYERHLRERVPAEFQGMATLWSETQMLMLYHGMEETWARGSGLPVHGVYRGLVLALQWFAHKHPEYDFVWQWEMDLRYTGHWYQLFSKMDNWTRAQPRKLLWERNSRFYIPALHGSWEDFSHMVRLQTESGTDSPNNVWAGLTGSSNEPKGDRPIWGPERPQNKEDWFEIENDPVPPSSYKDDKYTWGVGEDADLITLNPLFDPEFTTWGLANDATGYNRSQGLPPRRVAIITASRLSKRLLDVMHRETAIKKHHAFPEMWAGLAALSHGYKAVYAPHPVFVDREWPLAYLGATMNAGRNGATGAAPTSVFGDREHNFLGMTWYYNAGFSGNLWRRWMGLKVDDLGGAAMELEGEGRMCVPPILLHPIKGVELPVEEIKVDKGGGGEEMMDPTA